MKRTLSLTFWHRRFRRVLLFGMVCATPVRADTTISVSNIPGYPGTTVSVPVALRNATNVVAAQFDVSFATNKVTSGAPVPGSAFSNYVMRSREIAPGVRRTVVYSRNNTSYTNRALAAIPFTLAPTERVSSGPLRPEQVILARRDATPVAPLTLNAGTIFISPAHRNPDGTVDFFLPSQADRRYVIEATTNFVQWINLLTNVANGDFMDLTDADAVNYPYRFYRSVSTNSVSAGGSAR